MKTFEQWKRDKQEHDVKSSKMLLVVMLVIMLVAMLSSCATNGYGCKGRGKLITRVPQ